MKTLSGFTLVELLVVIAIIGVLAAIITLIINPIELMKRSRDTRRLQDLDNLSSAINLSMSEAKTSLASILCKESGEYPCSGSSNTGSRITDGTGWIKADLASDNAVKFPTLPIDPTNNNEYHYTYCADLDKWEINTVLESDQFRPKMAQDGGNEMDKYEVGSDYFLMSSGSCEY